MNCRAAPLYANIKRLVTDGLIEEVASRVSDAAEARAAAEEPPRPAAPTAQRRHWAELMPRSFGFDVLVCDRCGGGCG